MAMHGLLPQAAALRKLRLHSAGGDSLRARLNLETALNGVDWAPPGLSPQAVLLVRRLVLSPSPASALAPQVSRLLQASASAARRPWLQADAAAADAVLFLDEAELAACLVSDALQGCVSAHWWWRAVLANRSAQDWLRTEVLARGQLIAPVLALLSGRGQAVAWAARWSDTEAQDGLAAMAWAHGWAPAGDANAAAPLPQLAREADVRNSTAHGSTPADRARLSTAVPELHQAATLRTPAAQLLAAALMLSRDAAWLKSAPGTAAWMAWVAEHQKARLEPSPQLPVPSDPGDVVIAAPPRPAQDSQAVAAHQSNNARPVIAAETSGRTRTTDLHLTDKHATPSPRHPPPPPGEPTHRQSASTPSARKPSVRSVALPTPRVDTAAQPLPSFDMSKRHVDTFPLQATHPSQADLPSCEASLCSPHAGLFYLLNIALALKLYGDFTMPRAPGLALSPWDLLALAGRHWFGADFERDPLWPLLAELAGRSATQRPGRGFVPPNPKGRPGEWHIDPDWLAPWGSDPALRWRRTAHRVQARHPAGFVVCDIARGVAPATGGASARWLRHLLGYVCARTALALGCDHPANVPRLLCCHTGEVQVSAVAVDVLLSLETLPLPLRIAGLDRNPGWIPAAGRSIQFHFR